MGIFDFLKSKENSNQEKKKTKKLETVFDLFDLDFQNSPDDSFIKGNSETDDDGDQIMFFRKELNPPELGLFDILEIKIFENITYNIFSFSNVNFSKMQIDKLKYFVDKMYLFYGEDLSGHGRFSSSEIDDIKDDSWEGRDWIKEEGINTAFISYDDEMGLSFIIWVKK